MSTAPLVTIGIPTYNGADRLPRALASAIGQDYGALEIIVSDNASTDHTVEVVTAAARTRPDVRLVRMPENRGAIANYLSVLREARGTYFAWLGDDDRLDPDYISVCVRELEASPDVVLVGGKPVYYQGEREQLRGEPMTIDHHDSVARVIEYYRSVSLNGIFYGVARIADLRAVAWPAVMGGDWLLVASLAYRGQLRTLDSIHVHRENTWPSRGGHAKLASRFGLPAWQGRFPMTAIAIAAAKDVAMNPQYDAVPAAQRAWLATRVMGAILRKGRLPAPLRRLAKVGRFMRGLARS